MMAVSLVFCFERSKLMVVISVYCYEHTGLMAYLEVLEYTTHDDCGCRCNDQVILDRTTRPVA
jgi:hypothetical protein